MDKELIDAIIAEIEDIRACIFGHDGILAKYIREVVKPSEEPTKEDSSGG